jgi:FAD/FMN-containing dehydrogenase
MTAVITDPSIVAGYLTDASNIRGHAEGLFRPRTSAEVAQVLAACQASGTPVTITAGRTSTTAGPVPFGGYLLSTELLREVRYIRHDTAAAEGGIRLGEFQSEIERYGRFFPPDPTSRHDCTLGAAIANNASGARSFRYGPTRPWIVGVQVVLPTGDILTVRRGEPIPADWPVPAWTPPRVKTAAGYEPTSDLIDVFIGQEGTLGVITEAEVRLTDLPRGVLGIIAFFPSRDALLATVQAARTSARAHPQAAISPRAIEYLDRGCLDLVAARVGGVPEGAQGALFLEQELVLAQEEHLAAWWELLASTAGSFADDTVVTDDEAGLRKLQMIRHAVPAGINEHVVRNGMPKLGTDLAVPDHALAAMMDRYETCPLPQVTFGHIGDNHLHCNVLPRTPAELEQARRWYHDLALEAVHLGGTVSAEHGIGKSKVHLLEEMVGPDTLSAFRALKRHLDPAWILGRGTLLSAEV